MAHYRMQLVRDDKILNDKGLRNKKEFVNHKF